MRGVAGCYGSAGAQDAAGDGPAARRLRTSEGRQAAAQELRTRQGTARLPGGFGQEKGGEGRRNPGATAERSAGRSPQAAGPAPDAPHDEHADCRTKRRTETPGRRAGT